ncbi:MAG: hypothetical protein O3B13_09835 [Planctomycetota bacterium]|nr:hypothetical protein [Planctomycetota bacterium]MDA1163390.1 hypothetical protein [Planctomycetota bacterium]
MSDQFDPYYIWLGIPPKDQPANYYRLLGLQDFEENSDVIDAAANRQTSYLHQMANGPHRKESQQLLNEIAGARRGLLNPELKLEYDNNLRAGHATAEPAIPVASAMPLIDTGELPSGGIPSFDFSAGKALDAGVNGNAGFSGAKTGATSKARPTKQPSGSADPNVSDEHEASVEKKSIPRQWIILGCSIVAVAIVGFFLTNGSNDKPKTKAKTKTMGTSTRLDGSGAAVRTGSDSDGDTVSPNDPDGGNKGGRTLFDFPADSESNFNVPSSVDENASEKKK